ncbi:MAG TPA: Rieske 2Fe-2S domain-containing protein [Stellaceae bacterium]|nr:Rieske 2Fe-2S domain-containing protein [Stellaceae bacterium]
MITREENERLVRVRRGTPAGELLRRYWQPACLSSELPEKDGAPIRVKLLGEDLIAFRDTGGKTGLVAAFCPHRRAPLFFARNEELGLRCVYHGWKFNVAGQCVDMPSEPGDSPMKADAKVLAYPTYEKAGVVWAYMGPKEAMPEPPDYEWMRAPDTHRYVSKTYESCNYLQALEGGLDTAHSSYLHNMSLGNTTQYRLRDRAPRLDVVRTDYGYYYVSTRKAGEDGHYVRLYHYVLPYQQMRGGLNGIGRDNHVPKLDGHLWVPIDDGETNVYNWGYSADPAMPISEEMQEAFEHNSGRGKDDLIPGTFKLKRNLANDYLIDRQVQKTQTFTGIDGINTQDFALQEGMGPIVDRSQEYLGSSDRAIVTLRNVLLEAIAAVERGEPAPGTDPATHRGIRPYDGLVPPGSTWRETFAEGLVCAW